MMLLVALLYLVVLVNSKPILPIKDYTVTRKVIYTQDAPAPVAPFNQGIQINYMLYLTGQIGIDPKTGHMISDNVVDQTHQVLKNLEAVLNAAGSSVDQLAHCLIILTNIEEDYEIVNQIYSQWFKSPEFYPARSSMGVVKLPFNAKVAIECQAYTTKEI
ncbi:unnamed protein product [Rotaria sordida]|uniref:Uncharacterized protein n=1 Tax=Rotaria sordida TaxID=392033 RepID=A0A814ILI2_9BILA|nr:unnamed protein product [Rotaria sordida]CAF1371747.1 unnamed protein product [Rotaria sordida]CAF1433203.1 unnamed protein product [Rotaria sordida]CAF1611968.1 unnamed protein product [Rotaria sordida]CAF4094864.1 unnamed protein product [Rotaria sordida]